MQLECHRRIGGPLTKLPNDFKSFVLNAKNKQQLIRRLLCEWQSHNYAHHLRRRSVYFVCGTECVCLPSENGVITTATDNLQSDQEEADTRIILHCLFVAATASADSTIIVRSPDTDVMVLHLLLSYANGIRLPLLFDTGMGNKRRLADIQSIVASFGTEVCSSLPALHGFTGCDYTSAFVHRRKTKPLHLLQQNNDFIQLFSQFGSQPELKVDMFTGTERFVCSMYSRQAYSDINKLRFDLFQSRYDTKADFKDLAVGDRIDVSLLPPWCSSLLMLAQRANYVTYFWRNSHVAFANIPPPDGFGWQNTPDSLIKIARNDSDVMPRQLLTFWSQITVTMLNNVMLRLKGQWSWEHSRCHIWGRWRWVHLLSSAQSPRDVYDTLYIELLLNSVEFQHSADRHWDDQSYTVHHIWGGWRWVRTVVYATDNKQVTWHKFICCSW